MLYTLPKDMYGDEILREFLSKYHLRIKHNGKIVCQSYQDDVVIASVYIGITDIAYSNLSADGALVEVCYQTSDNERRDYIENSMQVTISFKGGISFDSSVLFDDLKMIIKDKKYAQHLQIVYKSYVRGCIKKWLNLNPGLLFQCGWFKEEKKEMNFKSITYRDSEVIKAPYSWVDTLIFNGLVPEFSRITLDSYCNQHDLHGLFSFLQNKCALFLFTCTIHSFLCDYAYNSTWKDPNISNTDTGLFSLCIYGRDIAHVKTVANLLLNVFDIPKEQWPVISKKIHISASSICSNKIDALKMYADVPVIFTTRKNRFYKSSRIIKKIHTERQKRKLHIFPVYISEIPISADEIVNCCVDDIPTDENLGELHSNMCFILYQFIHYLSDIYRTKDTETFEEYRTIRNMANREIEKLHTTISDSDFIELIENKLPEILLMSSLETFRYSFFSTPLNPYVDMLTETFKSYITKSEDIPVVSNSDKVDYIPLIAEFIHESIRIAKNEEWIFETTEKNEDGTKEVCYCITTKEGFKQFTLFLEKKKIETISTRYFTRVLESKGILKTLISSTAKCNKRRHKNVYIIKKMMLETALT